MPDASTPAMSASERARNAIAASVTRSWATIPHFAVAREIPAGGLQVALIAARDAHPATTITDLLLRALARAVEATGVGDCAAVGLSVASRLGVVNVALENPAACSLEGLSRRRREAVERARAGSLRSSDLKPFTVALSNLGTHGAHWFTGIVPNGSSLLLTTGAVRPSIDADGAPTSAFWAVANADHRAHDGADVAALLVSFEAHCSDPA
jgi:pyruvate dehydrogenase E2 component (dihydrolipoamide acetyltransferase)